MWSNGLDYSVVDPEAKFALEMYNGSILSGRMEKLVRSKGGWEGQSGVKLVSEDGYLYWEGG